MYSIKDAEGVITEQASIVITIPPEVQAELAAVDGVEVDNISAQNISVIARGRVLPSGNLSVGITATPPASDPEVVINATNNTATI